MGFAEVLRSVSQCFSPNLGNFRPLFLQIYLCPIFSLLVPGTPTAYVLNCLVLSLWFVLCFFLPKALLIFSPPFIFFFPFKLDIFCFVSSGSGIISSAVVKLKLLNADTELLSSNFPFVFLSFFFFT